MRQKRLAVIGIRGFPGVQGGVESHCEQLIPRLADKWGCKVRVYRRRPYLTDRSADSATAGIEFRDLPSTRVKGFETVWHTFLCCLHLLVHRVDVVNIHNIGPGMFTPLLRLMGFKVVLTYHSPNYEHDKWGRASKILLRICEKISLRCANRVIFVSPRQREKYSAKVQRRSEAIPNGITPIGSDKGTDFLERHGIRKGRYVLAVGRLTPEKGFEYLIEACGCSEAVEQLVIAGSSDHNPRYLDDLKRLDTAGKTVFTGFTTGRDLAQLYTHARLYALSSLNEGFPMVLLEAMSHRLPVVCSDLPATHIIELPATHYARRGDAAALQEAIERMLSTEQEHTNYDLSRYDWDDIAQRTADVYGELFRK